MGEETERLARLETKLDHVLDNQVAFRTSFEKHDERLKTLEQSRSHLVGFSAAVAAVMTLVLTHVKNALQIN